MRYLHQQGDVEDWIRRAGQGDERAFTRLHIHLEHRVTAYVKAEVFPSTVRWTQTEEIVEQAFAEVFRGLAKSPCRTEAELVRRLLRVAYERIRDAARGAQKLAGESAAADMNGHAFAGTTGPVTHADDLEMLHRLIDALPEAHASVVQLHVRDGLDFAAIGERLGITADAAYRRYVKARRVLMERSGHLRDE